MAGMNWESGSGSGPSRMTPASSPVCIFCAERPGHGRRWRSCILPPWKTGERVKQTAMWYTKSLGDAAYGADRQLEESLGPAFQKLYAREGSSPDIAVFT